MSVLLERVEAATGPDRGVDTAVWLAFTPGATYRKTRVKHAHSDAEWDVEETREPGGRLVAVPAYTASLDAALALVERALPAACCTVGKNLHHGHWVASVNELHDGAPRLMGWGQSGSPALALLAALLAALSPATAVQEQADG